MLQFCPLSQLASSLTERRKKKRIYIWSLRNFWSCCLEDARCFMKFWDAGAYKCPLTFCFGGSVFCLCINIHIQRFLFSIPDLTAGIQRSTADTQATTRLYFSSSAYPHAQSARFTLVIFHIDSSPRLNLSARVFLRELEPLHRLCKGDINFEWTPPWKEIPTPDPLYASLPLSPHTLGDCASPSASHTTFSTQHCQTSSSICLPPVFRSLLHLHEGNEPRLAEH